MSITSDSRIADLPTAVKDKARDAKDTAQAKIQDIQHHLYNGTEAVRDKADQAAAKLPAPVVGRLTEVMAAVRQRPVPAVVALLAVLLVLRRLLRRNS